MAKPNTLGLKPNQPNQCAKEVALIEAEYIEPIMGNTRSASLFAYLLTTKRPAHTHGEHLAASAIEQFLTMQRVPYTMDKAHNIIADLRDGTSNVLFSSHYDSAHRGEQPNGYSNKVSLSSDGSHFRGVDACIGADDASGIFVMARMIEAGVPALYILHASEEVGGIGSHYIADNTPEVLDGVTHAIAFDRRGTRDIIWQQGGEDCASEGTAGVFAYLLNRHGFDYRPDDGGSFTDTKLYRHLVPECFNVSVGYDNEHTSEETQDIQHLLKLADVCCELDWPALPVWRDPDCGDYYGTSWDALRYDYGLSTRSTRYDNKSFALEDWPMREPIDPAGFDNWTAFFAADFDTAMDFAYESCVLSDVDMLEFLFDDDTAHHATVFAMLDRKYPLQGETK